MSDPVFLVPPVEEWSVSDAPGYECKAPVKMNVAIDYLVNDVVVALQEDGVDWHKATLAAIEFGNTVRVLAYAFNEMQVSDWKQMRAAVDGLPSVVTPLVADGQLTINDEIGE